MESTHRNDAQTCDVLHAADDWTLLVGKRVEIYEDDQIIDCGDVDAVTNDGNILWLAYDGATPRRLIESLPARRAKIRAP